MNNALMRCFKYLAVLAIFTMFIPIVATVDFLTFGATIGGSGRGAGVVYVFSLLLAAVGFFGYFAAFLVYTARKKLPEAPITLLNILRLVVGMAIIVGLLLTNTGNKTIGSVTFATLIAILGGVAYFLGGYYFSTTYGEVITTNRLVLSVGLNLVAAFLIGMFTKLFEIEYSSAMLAPPLLLFTVAYYLIRNQSNIDELMKRRRHSLAHLPRKIRYYNIFLTLSVMTVIAIGYVFRGRISQFLSLLVSIGQAFLRWISRIIQKIVEAFASSESYIAAPPAEVAQPMSPLMDEKSDMTIFYLIIAVIILGLLINYHRQIARFFSEKWRLLLKAIVRLFAKFNLLKALDEPSDEYTDTVETLSSCDDMVPKANNSAPSSKRWKKEYQSFLRTADSSEKLRAGYRLVGEGLALNGVKIANSDTTFEVLAKAVKDLPTLAGEAYSTATTGYNGVRYGDCPAKTEDIACMGETLAAILALL